MRRFALVVSLSILGVGCSEQETVLTQSSQEAPAPLTITPAPPPEGITTALLLDEMTDLRRLAEFPDPYYTNRQASSYDRRSKSPDDHASWFANGDAGQYIREEDHGGRKEFVMMDEDGPGAIVRIWSANPDGTLRIYLDGADQPALEAPMKDVLGGRYPAWPRPIAGEYSAGWNLYFPIPYAKHCKVTSDAGKFYYHVNYRTYDPQVRVETFTLQTVKTLEPRIKELVERLDKPREGSAPPADRVKTPLEARLEPGGQATLVELNGPKAICGLLLQTDPANDPNVGRGVVLSIAFDNEVTVQCPLGDFYGAACGRHAYASIPLGITAGDTPEMWSHWYMPFQRTSRISVENLGDQSVRVFGRVSTVPYHWTDRTLLFHAKWRIERELPARPQTDWTHLDVKGRGRFVGGELHIVNSSRDWWGEGDEKIYVDGEKFPSTFGTGSEDYYGYAWCNPSKFFHAYHNQPHCDGPGNYGNTTVNRFHILDDIPFKESFKFDMENWHGSDKLGVKTARSAVSYWYARPGSANMFRAITKADIQPLPIAMYQPKKVKGAIEGEAMKILEKTGRPEPQQLGDAYSNDTHLWWKEASPGDKLVLGFDVDQAGARHVIVRLTRAADYARVQLYVNNQKAGEPIDLYHDGVTQTDEIDLGEFDLKKGQNTLTAEIVGANEKAIKSHMFGIDYVLLN